MRYLKQLIKSMLADGKYFFTRDEACAVLGITHEQFRAQAYRLAKNLQLRRLVRNFFMIIPTEYHHLGGLPPHWIIDTLMRHLNQNYYVGLLSAAALHGAAHQQPMVFQIITDKLTRSITLERGTIEFHVSRHCLIAEKKQITLPTGYTLIATIEQTMIDLVRFPLACGGLNNVATVLNELAQTCNATHFEHILTLNLPITVLQRLGYILEFLKHGHLAQLVHIALTGSHMQIIPLIPSAPHDGQTNHRFKIIINEPLEIDT